MAGKKDKNAAKMKKSFPAFATCELLKRNTKVESLQLYDGYIIIDIDDIDHSKITELSDALKSEKHVVLFYISVSGNGLKVVHSTDYKDEEPIEYHRNAFLTLKDWYKTNHNVTIDEACKDYSRMSYLAHDENIFYQPRFTPIPIKTNSNQTIEKDVDTQLIKIEPVKNAGAIVNDIYCYLDEKGLSITKSYNEWVSVCFALKFELAEEDAKKWFLKLSALDTEIYNEGKCDEKFESCKVTRAKSYNIGTIISYAQSVGYKPSSKLKSVFGFEIKKRVAIHSLTQNGIRLRYNKLKSEIEYHHSSKKVFHNKSLGSQEWYKMDDDDLNLIYLQIFNNTFDKQKCQHLLTIITERHDPINAFIKSIPDYDGKDYIHQLSKTMEYDCEDDLAELMIRKWLVAMVGMLADPNNCINENILVLQGCQGSGKTRWVRSLARPFLDYFVSKNINPTNKDDKILSAENFIILFDEMENMISSKSNIEGFKALTSETTFVERRPYERLPQKFRRIASYIGTINRSAFLRDTTGNRRFFVLPTTNIDYQHKIDVMKIYSEALHLYENGFQYYLDDEEQKILSMHNQSFEEESIEKELLEKWIEPANSKYGMTATEVLQAINEREDGILNCKVGFLGKLLQSMGYQKNARNATGNKAYPVKIKDDYVRHLVNEKSKQVTTDMLF